jgi:hypothetical protein
MALYSCPECSHRCAESAYTCPSCGHCFQQPKVRPGDGWGMAIFWGIMLAWFIPTFVVGLLVFVLVLIGAIGAASLAPR